MQKFVTHPLAKVRTDQNVRIDPGSEDVLRALGGNYKKRPVHPLIGAEEADGWVRVLDGWRRVLGLRLIGESQAEFLVTDEDLKPEDIVEIGLITAIHRADLTGYEKWRGCLRILQMHPGWLGKDLAAYLNLDASMVTRILSPSQTLVAVQEALKEGVLTLSQVYAISKVCEQQQHEMLAAALNGATRDQLELSARKVRNSHSVKVPSVKIALASGTQVVIKAEELDLESGAEALGEALKQVKKAIAEQLDVKTAQAVWRDRAKVGG